MHLGVFIFMLYLPRRLEKFARMCYNGAVKEEAVRLTEGYEG